MPLVNCLYSRIESLSDYKETDVAIVNRHHGTATSISWTFLHQIAADQLIRSSFCSSEVSIGQIP